MTAPQAPGPDLRTKYLGFELPNPVVASASPLTGTIEGLLRLQEAGAAAAVLPSLFEEQIEHDEMAIHALHEYGSHSFAEALDYAPDLGQYNLGPDAYYDTIRQAREQLRMPVIASLNGATSGGWVRCAREMQDAGAPAIELNVYFVPSDPTESGIEVEARYLGLVEAVRKVVQVPLAVKVGPGFSSPGHMARRLVDAGADGLVLFNRYLRPDVDLDSLDLVPRLVLSDSDEIRIPLQWIGLLRGRVNASLAATSGVHTHEDALKLLLVGADVVMAASSLLKHGPGHVATILSGITAWMQEREYASVAQMKGSLSRDHCPDPRAYERSNYMRTLIEYTGRFI